ncbi:MAG: SpaA isopeptide-forming pilin-related protein [Oscillospiraceae bacterium]|nr:SpaA isopeptide-forming pilin-related protein [Oscillospiraceae bacterium]
MKKTNWFGAPKRILSALVALAFFGAVLLIPRVARVNADIGDTYAIGKNDSAYLGGVGSDAYEIKIKNSSMPFYGPPLTVTDDGDKKIIEAAYCISRITDIGEWSPSYIQVSPGDFFANVPGNGNGAIQQNESELRWIAAHGFVGTIGGSYGDLAAPGVLLANIADFVVARYFEPDEGSAVKFENLTAGEAIKATQSALWYYSDPGTDLDPNVYSGESSTDSDKRVLAFYNALVELADRLASDWDENNQRVSLDFDFESAEAKIIEEDDKTIKAYGPIKAKITTNDATLNNATVSLSAYVETTKWGEDKVAFAYDEQGERRITDGIIEDFTADRQFYLVFTQNPAGINGVDEELRIEITGEISAQLTLTSRPEPVIFAKKNAEGNADWSSQAVIASVPASKTIRKDASLKHDITIPRVSALIQKKAETPNGIYGPGAGYKFQIWEYSGNAENPRGDRLQNPDDSNNVFTTDANGQIVLKELKNGLKPGEYWIEEVENENTGIYRPIKTKFTVTGHSYSASAPVKNYFEFTNSLIEIKFVKTVDGAPGPVGAGFEFGIWKYKEEGDHKGEPITEFTTDAQGEFRLYGDILPPGRYWVEELSNEKTFAFSALVKDDFTVEVSEDKEIELNNKAAEVKFKKTLDPKSTDTPEGFEFDIYRCNSEGDGPEGDAIGRIVTDSNGEASLFGLPEGKYWIEEASNAKSEKYRLIKEAFAVDFAEFKNGVFDIELYNGLTEVEITKTVDRGNDAEGFEFDIYESDGNGPSGEPVAYIKTDARGKALINLPKGKYWIKERLTDKSKEYFLIDEEFEVKNDGENHIDPIANYLRNVLIEKDKLDSNGNAMQPKDVTGITFRIFSIELKDDYKNQTKTWQQIIEEGAYYAKEFSLGIDGTYMIEGIPEGDYWIIELPHEKNAGYYLIDEKFAVSPGDEKIPGAKQGGASKINVNYYIFKPLKNFPVPKINVTVEKSLRDAGDAPLNIPDSAVYEVTLTPAETDANRPVYTFTLNKANHWSQTITDALAGEYIILETKGGEGYDISYSPVIDGTSDRVSMTQGENAFKFIVKNKERPITPPNSVTVGKSFDPISETPDEDVEFTIVLKQENVVKYTLIVNRANGWVSKISNVTPGTYTVEETNIPAGYEMVSLSHSTVTVDSNSTIMITAINKKSTTTTEPTPPAEPTTTTEPTTPAEPTTTTEPTTPVQPTTPAQPTSPETTEKHTTESSAQPTRWPTQPTTPAQPTSPETKETPATESPTQPIIDAPTTEEQEDFEELPELTVPLGNISLTDDDETTAADEYEEIIEDKPPLVDITFTDEATTPKIEEEYELMEQTLPLMGLTFPEENEAEEEAPRDNPDTGDGGIFMVLALTALFALGFGMLILANRIRRKNK